MRKPRATDNLYSILNDGSPAFLPLSINDDRSRCLTVPQDARLMALMLASKGVEDADERVLLQMLDFAHRKHLLY